MQKKLEEIIIRGLLCVLILGNCLKIMYNEHILKIRVAHDTILRRVNMATSDIHSLINIIH